MEIYNENVLNDLSRKAVANPRLRQNLDLRNNDSDCSQRMLNAMEPGTNIPIHRHRDSSETVFIVRGAVDVIYYDDNFLETERVTLDPAFGNYGLQIPKGQWHRSVSRMPGTVIVESKDGKYTPLKQEDIKEVTL